MKQSEKSKRTYEKIINAAIIEFGTKSYEGASLNNVCNEHDISKGLIYHHFKNKDDVYLQCANVCFQKLMTYLSKLEVRDMDVRRYLKELFNYRLQFFHDNPAYCRFFFYAVLQPPKHLLPQIKLIRNDFDSFNIQQFKNIIEQVTLRSGITEKESLEYFCYFQDMFNTYWGNKLYEGIDFDALIEKHETKLVNMIDMLLYGIAKEDTHHDSTHS